MWYPTHYAHFEALTVDSTAHHVEKKAISEQMVAQHDRRFPDLSGDIDVVSVATPPTYRRHIGHWQGSANGWRMTMDNASQRLPLHLSALKGFYMAN